VSEESFDIDNQIRKGNLLMQDKKEEYGDYDEY